MSKEINKFINGVEVNIRFEEQTEEIKDIRPLSKTEEEKLICQLFGSKITYTNGQWCEIKHQKDKDIEDFSFRLEIKSDFKPLS